ncbi:MAG: protease inhibitor I42 family protein [Chloroflexi bacterium]|nr:protease inhibitor I42 family protein [Chloroflexota bacterium]
MWGILSDVRNALVITVVLVFLAGGCSPSEVNVDANANGGQKQVARGQTLFVTLESNPSTGYRWDVVEIDGAVLRQSSESVFKSFSISNPPLLGMGGTETFRFETLGAGMTTLKMVYHRVWENDVPPLKTFTVQVAVR